MAQITAESIVIYSVFSFIHIYVFSSLIKHFQSKSIKYFKSLIIYYLLLLNYSQDKKQCGWKKSQHFPKEFAEVSNLI